MPVDYSQIPDDDLKAMSFGDLSRVSDKTLKMLNDGFQAQQN